MLAPPGRACCATPCSAASLAIGRPSARVACAACARGWGRVLHHLRRRPRRSGWPRSATPPSAIPRWPWARADVIAASSSAGHSLAAPAPCSGVVLGATIASVVAIGCSQHGSRLGAADRHRRLIVLAGPDRWRQGSRLIEAAPLPRRPRCKIGRGPAAADLSSAVVPTAAQPAARDRWCSPTSRADRGLPVFPGALRSRRPRRRSRPRPDPAARPALRLPPSFLRADPGSGTSPRLTAAVWYVASGTLPPVGGPPGPPPASGVTPKALPPALKGLAPAVAEPARS